MATKHPLVVIVGPTASGKTALAIELAKRFNGEIICADSRTVYLGMNISTAKPSIEEQQGIPHHLLDVALPSDRFTAADFKNLAQKTIDKITDNEKIPILVGGSGLYVDAVLYDYQFGSANAQRDPQNSRHLLAARRTNLEPRPDTLVLGLTCERDVLRKRIESRVNEMVEQGLIDEIKRLTQQYGWDCAAFDAPAFKAFKPCLVGEISMQDATQLFVTYDMQLAKKQMTWFKRNKSIHWLENREESVELVTTFLNKYQ